TSCMLRPARRATCASSWRATRCARRSRASTWKGQAGASSPGGSATQWASPFPTTGELWANNNDRDNLGDNVPPEHLNILRDGKWYGWPQCYLPNQPNPEFTGADCSRVEPPALTVQAHSAPLGLAFYTGARFPADYAGDAFMTYHGSWNRSV